MHRSSSLPSEVSNEGLVHVPLPVCGEPADILLAYRDDDEKL
jgi:hypothetical protein